MVEHYPAPLDTINVFVRGGSVLPVVLEQPGVTPTAELVLNTPAISLYCYLDDNGVATGSLLIDDGYSENSDRHIHRAQFRISNQRLEIVPVTMGTTEMVRVVSSVSIGGVVLSGGDVEVMVGNMKQRDVTYDASSRVLVVKQLQSAPGKHVTTDTHTIVTWKQVVQYK